MVLHCPIYIVCLRDLTWCRSEEKGPNVQTASTLTKYNATQPIWREKFHLCVFESNQVLKLVIAHNMEYSAAPPLQNNGPRACV